MTETFNTIERRCSNASTNTRTFIADGGGGRDICQHEGVGCLAAEVLQRKDADIGVCVEAVILRGATGVKAGTGAGMWERPTNTIQQRIMSAFYDNSCRHAHHLATADCCSSWPAF